MKFLVIGLGSMGKRRIRNLHANDQSEVYGFDLRIDRRDEAAKQYGIKVFDSIEKALAKIEFDAFIISVPPDIHDIYIKMALVKGISCFVEASVIKDGLPELIELESKTQSAVVCPSCTLRFHPSIKKIKKLIEDGAIGKVSHYSYHSGQYLPDWHPWEPITDFYVSKRETGGCREIVPFELTWLNWVFGDVQKISGMYEKTIELGADISDVYALTLLYPHCVIGSLVIDIVSRFATRQLIINGDKGQILWNWNEKALKVYDANSQAWTIYEEPSGVAASGYNENIVEEMYIEEIRTFIQTVKKQNKFPNTLKDDYKILCNLYDLEMVFDEGMYKTY